MEPMRLMLYTSTYEAIPTSYRECREHRKSLLVLRQLAVREKLGHVIGYAFEQKWGITPI